MFGVHWWDKGSGKTLFHFYQLFQPNNGFERRLGKQHHNKHHTAVSTITNSVFSLPFYSSPVYPQALFPQIVFLLCSPFLSFSNLNFLKKICVLFSPSNRKLKIKFRFSLNMWVNLDGPLFWSKIWEQKWLVWSLGPWASPGLTDLWWKEGFDYPTWKNQKSFV